MNHPPAKNVIVAADQRLSRAPIWEIQRRYFLNAGIDAWRQDVVPHDISSNPVMARAYADVVLGFLRDCHADAAYAIDQTQPLYIVELGSGAGRLGYHFLNHFCDRYERAPFAGVRVKLILTDFVPSLVAFWRNHERFQPWVEAGWLDFAHFDAAAPAPLQLMVSGKTLDATQTANPIVLLANYFFDGIPQDSYVVEAGQLQENLLTLYSDRPEPDLGDTTIWDRLTFAYEAIPTPPPYYENPIFDEILADYEAALADTTLLFPNTGLDCLQFWHDLSRGRLLLLSADKGFTLPDAMHDQADPDLDLHGSFSMMVNYHAIGQYVARRGGLVMQPDYYQDNIQVGAYLLGEPPQAAMETMAAFHAAVGSGGPDDFFGLKKAFAAIYADLSLSQLLNLIRLSRWDAEVLRRCLPAIRQHIQSIAPVWFDDIQQVLDNVWAHFLPIGEPNDLALQLGLTCADMGHFASALDYFAASAAAYGENAARDAHVARCRTALSATD